MNKQELIAGMAQAMTSEKHGRPPYRAVEDAVDAFCRVAGLELALGGHVALPGLGKLVARERAPRLTRNPRTGEELRIPARMTAVFRPAKELREAMNPSLPPVPEDPEMARAE